MTKEQQNFNLMVLYLDDIVMYLVGDDLLFYHVNFLRLDQLVQVTT